MSSPVVRRVLHGQLVAKQSLTLAWPQIAAHPWVSRCSSEHAAVNRITLHEFNPNFENELAGTNASPNPRSRWSAYIC